MDILCCYKSAIEFQEYIIKYFGLKKNFKSRLTEINQQETVLINFETKYFEIEIFGQIVPVIHQYGYRHMIIEDEIIRQKGELFRQEIIALKNAGYKTEPAFAELLSLSGNPYETLLTYPV